MAVTRLVRKALKNRVVSSKRVNNLKRVTTRPVIKNVDIEQIKEEFANKKLKSTKKEAPLKEEAKLANKMAETPKTEVKTEETTKAVSAVADVKVESKKDTEKKPAKKESSESKKEETAANTEKKPDSE